MSLGNNGVTGKYGMRVRVLTLLFTAVLFTWTTGAVAENTPIPSDADNPGPHATSKTSPDDMAASKAGGVTFNIFYDDVDQSTGVGFDDPVDGTERRARVVDTLAYVSGILGLPGRSCDVEFDRSDTDVTGPLYLAGAHLSSQAGFVNGYAFEHIVNNHDMSTTLKDMLITMNFGWPWYSGTGTPSTSQYDLRSALLQVITQGLGMRTLSYPDGRSKWWPTAAYSVWDGLLETSAQHRLWTGNPPQFQGTAADLTGTTGGLFFVGAKAVEFNEAKPAVYTPSTFDSDKSLGFWKQTVDVVMNPVVMKPVLAPGETVREYSLLDQAALYDIGYTSIILPVTFTLRPRGGWFTVGERLSMSVRAVGAVGTASYQWQKDGSDYPGATATTFVADALTLGHAGNYTCVVTDDRGSHDSPAANVKVFVAGQLPAMGIVGLCLVAAACVLAGALIILRRE